MPRKKGYKEIFCRTCGRLIKRFRRSSYRGGHVPKELILKAIRRHYKKYHPRKFKEFAKKAVKTKREYGIYPFGEPYAFDPEEEEFEGEGFEPEPKVRVRRKMISKPEVIGYDDYEAGGMIRVLERRNDFFPEFALYMEDIGKELEDSLEFAGFKEETKNKWVLRTNKFNIFVYI